MKQHISVWWANSSVFMFVWSVPLPLTWMNRYDQVFIWRVSVSIWVCLWFNNPSSTHTEGVHTLRNAQRCVHPHPHVHVLLRSVVLRVIRPFAQPEVGSDGGCALTAVQEADEERQKRPDRLHVLPIHLELHLQQDKHTHDEKMQYIYCISDLQYWTLSTKLKTSQNHRLTFRICWSAN